MLKGVNKLLDKQIIKGDLCVFPDFTVNYTHKLKRNAFDISFRSSDDRQDVRLIAEHFSGGGHRNASGTVFDASNTQLNTIFIPI